MLWPQDALGRVDVGTSAAFSFDAGFLLFGCSGGLPSDLMVAVSCFTRLFTNSILACQSVFYRELLLRSGYSYRALPQSVLFSTGICATLPLLTQREVVSVGGPSEGQHRTPFWCEKV
jgi:hypothetical protein